MRNILVLIANRLATGMLTLWIVSLIIFLGVSALPGDIATEVLGQSASPETIVAFRTRLGLDLPLHERYFAWVSDILHGDFGISLANHRPIGELVFGRLSSTVDLAVLAAIMAVPLALGLGILAALYRNGAFDRAINLLTLTSVSFPEFFVAYVLILFLSVKAGLLPSLAGFSGGTVLGRIEGMVLPALTLTLVVVAHMMRMTRAALIGVLASPYIEMAKLKGVSPIGIVTRHALPNALGPIINVVVLNLAYLVVGVVVVEVVFVYPGLGQLMVDSVQKRDIPVVQACSLIFAATYIVLNLTADILATVTNPRLLHRR
ncbi:ABC transporter permease [Shinella curvata]|uniref:ABC transporter permease n=1 Tax=Shinella curvata TaxID=1817964 RepID=A0ABT8XMC5_9HYPH|nr:ABC transporter permease [Shinella curvata]MCJ8056768.1 ABC transporter permease [Shinella curvata]MDO6124885.1 ABC transporter permease [Shinella curvata]